MIVFTIAASLQKHIQALRNQNFSIGFAPTMGALHQGHMSLIKQCKEQCDVAVCSIFVNPTQFNDEKDFEKYPITIESDMRLLEIYKTDILFLPAVEEIYPQGLQQLQHFELGYLENILEGKYRPGHFQGVCNVVYKLLNIIKPNIIFLGRKDYQQYLVLKTMMQQFFRSINITAVDIAREASGLAMSSRNMRLSEDARNKAAAIYKCLQFIKQNIFEKDIDILKLEATHQLLQNDFNKVDYIEICNAATLLPVTHAPQQNNLIALAAAFIEEVRLIDNLML